MHILLAVVAITVALAAMSSPGGIERLGRIAYWIGNIVALGLLVIAWQSARPPYDNTVAIFFVVCAVGAWVIGAAIRYLING